MYLAGSDGRKVCLAQVQLPDGRTVAASKFGSPELDEVKYGFIVMLAHTNSTS